MFTRLANIFRGFLSLFVSGIEKRNPEALLELEQENLRKQIGSYNQSLAAHAGLGTVGTGGVGLSGPLGGVVTAFIATYGAQEEKNPLGS